MPSDFRYNPFDDVGTAVPVTELHVIPGTSPFTIRLNEVPVKGDPSSIVIKYVAHILNGVIEYGAIFTEVAAIPAAWQFRPDYNTGAASDQNWNTGTLLFNSADAGKCVEVTYQATGTLASVHSPRFPTWWLDRGDGSDGDFFPAANCTISGVKQYKNVFIPVGITVSVDRYALIMCQGVVLIWGTLRESTGGGGGGGAGGWENSDGNGANATAGGAGICSYGGAGGGWGSAAGGGRPPITDANIMLMGSYIGKLGDYGCGGAGGGGGANIGYTTGGAGGVGGGTITIKCQYFFNNGNINANGFNGGIGERESAGGGGGGGGGLVVIIAGYILPGAGVITVAGGAGGYSSQTGNGAAGGTGIVILKELRG